MIRIVIGGQTGANQAGWRDVRSLGLPTGGWMPRGFETEGGPCPEFAVMFGAIEVEGGYREHTQANARDSNGTVWFGDLSSLGVVRRRTGLVRLWAARCSSSRTGCPAPRI